MNSIMWKESGDVGNCPDAYILPFMPDRSLVAENPKYLNTVHDYEVSNCWRLTYSNHEPIESQRLF